MKHILRNDSIGSFPSKKRGRFLYRESCECAHRVDVGGNNRETEKTTEVGVSFPEDEERIAERNSKIQEYQRFEDLERQLVDLVEPEILEKVCIYCNNNSDLLSRYKECIRYDPTLQKVILSNSEDLKTDLDIIEARLRSEETHKDNLVVQGLWQSFGDINFREYSGDIPAQVIAYINTLSPTEKETLSDCFNGPSHHESYLGIRCMGSKKDDIFMLLIPEKYTKQKSKEAFYKGILTDGSRIQDSNADSENISFEITDTQSIRDELLKISKLSNPEEKKDQLRILIQSIKDTGETLLEEEGKDKKAVINGETIDIADGLVAQYLADWYKDPETHETLKSILLVQKEPNTFTFDSLGLAVLNKQITLEQLLANQNPPAQYIYILDNENYRPAALVQGESKKGYHYFDSEGKIGDPVQIKNGTQFKISSFNTDFSPVEDKITDLNTQDIVEQASKNTSILGRLTTRYQTMSAKQKSMLGEPDKDFYQQIVRQYQETQKHKSLNHHNHDYYQAGDSLALEDIGTPNPEPNEDGTYDVKLHGSEAEFCYNPDTNEAIIKNRGEGGDLHFPMEDQSVPAIKLFSYLAAYGNSDSIDRTQVGEEDLDSRQLVNKMNDLFPVEGTEYFRPGQMKEIANTLFYMKGKSFFWLLNHISIQKGNTTERVVNNDENASALSRMEMNANTIANNRFALWKFLENLGDRVIDADSLHAHMQKHNGQIILQEDGSLLEQKKEATTH